MTFQQKVALDNVQRIEATNQDNQKKYCFQYSGRHCKDSSKTHIGSPTISIKNRLNLL